MRRMVQYFLQGLLFLGPIALTAYVVVALFRLVDGWFPFQIPGLGVAITIAAIMLFGVLGSHVFTRGFLGVVEDAIERLPFVKLLYSAIKDLLGAFVGEKKRFSQPVLVQLGSVDGPRAIGFVTRESLAELGLPDLATVYLPQSYNFAGQLLVVPRARISPLAIPPAEAMPFVVSAGITGLEATTPALPPEEPRP